jgi:hypothetical protein
MNIKVSNLGPLRGPTEFDLKPLTILIGPNNAGKTWLAYTLGSLFRSQSIPTYIKDDEAEHLCKNYVPFVKAIDELLTAGAATIDLCQLAQEYGETYFNNIASHAYEWVPASLGTRRVSFRGLNFSIRLGEAKTCMVNRILSLALKSGIGLQKPVSATDDHYNLLLNVNKRAGQRAVSLYTSSQGDIDEKLPRAVIEEHLARWLLGTLHDALYPDVKFLPTERATLITSQIHLLGKPIIQASEVVADCQELIEALYRFGTQEMIKREREAQNTPAVSEYIQLAQLLEERILEGKLDVASIPFRSAQEMLFQPTGSSQLLEISAASSMVQQLTPLAFYLRYLAQPGELLIIDEPEMNLHPRAQVQVLEFLALLVNTGLHILTTTHSPYIIDHLLNLTKTDANTDREALSSKFLLQDKRIFMAKEQVSFYAVDRGKIINAMDDDADWNTFGKVSDLISDIYFSL